MNKVRLAIALTTILVVFFAGSIFSYYARGYRFDSDTFRFVPNGLLVLKSEPDGAQIYINGQLKTATNATITLLPNTYDIEVKKEGFIPWKKRLTIKEEVVTEANASLFRSAPSLTALTFSASVNPIPSSNFSKIAYNVPIDIVNDITKTGLWVLETINLPIGFTQDPKQITDKNLTDSQWQWSPNGRELLLSTDNEAFLLDASRFTPQNELVNISSTKKALLAEWEIEKTKKLDANMRKLPQALEQILRVNAEGLVFSPDEEMVLYRAINEASIPQELITPFPGASTQVEERDIKRSRTYVYNIKEDRNFLVDEGLDTIVLGDQPVGNTSRRIAWFPTSRHLVLAETNRVILMDYDGTNKQVAYSGSYVTPHVFPFASKQSLIILTNLGANSSPENLYTLNLK